MENFPVRPPKTTVRPHLLEKLIKITINGQIWAVLSKRASLTKQYAQRSITDAYIPTLSPACGANLTGRRCKHYP